MRTLKYILAFFISGVAIGSYSESLTKSQECATLSCDCTHLPSESWKDICEEKERSLKSACNRTGFTQLSYCSIHGPAANRIAVTLDSDTLPKELSNAIKLLSYKYAAIFWAIYKDMEFIELAIAEQKMPMAKDRLTVLQSNSDGLLNIQKRLIVLLEKSPNTEQVKASWITYSDDIETITRRLDDDINGLFQTINTSSKPVFSKALAVDALETTGKLYEHIGYANSQAQDFKQAAHAWKRSADIASLLLARAEKNGDQEQQEFYRYQTATRLHKASANWNLVTDTDKAPIKSAADSADPAETKAQQPNTQEGAVVVN